MVLRKTTTAHNREFKRKQLHNTAEKFLSSMHTGRFELISAGHIAGKQFVMHRNCANRVRILRIV